jgi:hypothetical protein
MRPPAGPIYWSDIAGIGDWITIWCGGGSVLWVFALATQKQETAGERLRRDLLMVAPHSVSENKLRYALWSTMGR